MRNLFKKLSTLFYYGINSVISTVVDVCIVWILVKLHVGIVAANTVGVLAGFLLGYVLNAAYVFGAAKSRIGFLIYFGTFLIGLFLADWLIFWGNTCLFAGLGENLNFLLSKGLSIVVPFFVMYSRRKWLYALLEKKQCN